MSENLGHLRSAIARIAERLPLEGAVILVRRDDLGFEVAALGGDVMALTGRFSGEFEDRPSAWSGTIVIEDQSRVRQELSQALIGGSAEVEYRILDSEGQAVVVNEHCAAIQRQSRGEPGALVSIITERGGASSVQWASVSGSQGFDRPQTIRALLEGIANELEEVLASVALDRARPPNILVVEGDEDVRRLIERALLRDGYAVLAVSTAAEAIEIFDAIRQGFDLLVTDVQLPERSGPALHRELRRRRPTLPALYVTGYGDEVIGGESPLGGHTGFLESPFSPEELRAEVRRILRAAGVAGSEGSSGIREGKSG